MITFFYIGEARFRDETISNHEYLFNLFRSNWPIEILDFTHDKWDRSHCPFDRSGAAQVWDFYQVLNKVNSDIVVKLRTDVYFGPKAAEVVLSEVGKIVENEIDVSLIGSEFRQHFDTTYITTLAISEPKVQDFVVAAHRRGLNSEENVMDLLTTGKPFKSGNKTWHFVYKPEARAYTVKCQMALVRKHYKDPNYWQVGWDYLQDYRDVEKALTWWTLQRPLV
jgi:hypothetical protein